MIRIRNITVAILFFCLLLFVVYRIGPVTEIDNINTVIPVVTDDLRALEIYVKQKEASLKNKLKPGNEAVIVWADSIPSKTSYSIVYLHGWSASREEGAPLHLQTARKFHCNLYLPRLSHHGFKGSEGMYGLTAEKLLASAKEALAIASKMGEKVIIMATSTGASLALYLAGENPCVAAVIMYSPNVAIYTKAAGLLSGPWGLELARLINGDYFEFKADAYRKKFWTHRYRVEALPQLQGLLDRIMVRSTFKKVTQPVFMGYFYKSEAEQDRIVSVKAMLQMFEQLGTPKKLKYKKAFPNAGHHVITSHVLSKDLNTVKKETFYFIENKIGLKPSVNLN